MFHEGKIKHSYCLTPTCASSLPVVHRYAVFTPIDHVGVASIISDATACFFPLMGVLICGVALDFMRKAFVVARSPSTVLG